MSAAATDPAAQRKRMVTSVMIASIAVHVAIGIGAAFLIVARYFAPAPAQFEVRRDVVLPAEEREHKMNMAEFDGLTPKPTLNEQLASLRPTDFALPDLPQVPVDQMLPLDAAAVVADQVSSLVGAAGAGAAGGGGSGMGGTGSGMSFFGITDNARSVVIMIDVSDSMFTRTGDASGRSLVREGKNQAFQAIRDEAIKLVQSLSINTRFGIIRWSGGAHPWKTQLVPANDANKAAAIEHIQTEVDFKKAPPRDGRPGGTRHDYALEEAFKLRPEVIYMLTDGNATAAQPGGGLKPIPADDIWKGAAAGQKTLEKEARLHVIYYITGQEKADEKRMLRTLAARNGGKFRDVKAK